MRAATLKRSLLVILCCSGIVVAAGHAVGPAGILVPVWAFWSLSMLLAALSGDFQSLAGIEFICSGLFCLATACFVAVFSLNAKANTTYLVGFMANTLLVCFAVLLIRWSEDRLLSMITAIPFFVSVVAWIFYARKQMYVQAAEHADRRVKRRGKG